MSQMTHVNRYCHPLEHFEIFQRWAHRICWGCSLSEFYPCNFLFNLSQIHLLIECFSRHKYCFEVNRYIRRLHSVLCWKLHDERLSGMTSGLFICLEGDFDFDVNLILAPQKGHPVQRFSECFLSNAILVAERRIMAIIRKMDSSCFQDIIIRPW